MEIIEELFTAGAPEVTLDSLDHTIRMLPRLRAKFSDIQSQIDLTKPIDFLSQLLEDFSAGLCRNLPLNIAADVAFALDYMYQETDLIPDSLPDIGVVDDAAVSNRVLCKHDSILKDYATERGFSWECLLAV